MERHYSFLEFESYLLNLGLDLNVLEQFQAALL